MSQTKETYKELTLLKGDKVEVMIARGVHISTANIKNSVYNMLNPKGMLDVVPFMMSELCLVNNNKESVEYYTNLLSDDYVLIADTIADVLGRVE